MSWTVTLKLHRINFQNKTIRRFWPCEFSTRSFRAHYSRSLASCCESADVAAVSACERCISGNTPECVWQAGAPGRQTERATGSGLPLIIWQETQTLRFLKMDGNLINSFLPTGCSAQMELSEGEGSGKGLAVVAKGWTVWKLLCGL